MATELSHRSTPKILAVAWREFSHTVLTKAFIIGAIGVPMLMMVLGSLAPLLTKGSTTTFRGVVAVIDPTGEVEPLLAKLFAKEAADTTGAAAVATGRGSEFMGGPLELTSTLVTDPAQREKVVAGLGQDELVAVITIPAAAIEAPKPDTPAPSLNLVVPNGTPSHVTTRLERMARSATVDARLAALGMDAANVRSIMRAPDVDSQRVSRSGELKREVAWSRMLLPIGFMMLLWICVFTSGQYLLTTTIEEKSSRVMEVLLSAVSPMQLLTGKLLGHAAVAFVMLAMYAGSAFLALSFFAAADIIQPMQWVWLFVYFVMAYFMIGTIMVAVGSAVSDMREAQALVGPAMIVLMVPLLLWLPISNSPNGPIATATSFVPPIIPFVMILRLASSSEPVAAWQIGLSIVIGAVSVVAMLRGASRIFRIGVLMQGKPPTPRELLRWMFVR